MAIRKLFRAEALEHQQARGMRAELIVLDPAATSWGLRLPIAYSFVPSLKPWAERLRALGRALARKLTWSKS